MDPVTGTVYVAVRISDLGYSAVLSYARDGRLNWVPPLPAEDTRGYGLSDVEVDPVTGNVYLSGNVEEFDLPTGFVIGYDARGRYLWQQRVAHGSGWVSASEVAVDPVRGLVYLGGSGQAGMSVFAFDRAGKRLWDATTPAATPLVGMPVDRRSGTVYLGGQAGFLDSSDYLTVAYSPTGAQRRSRVEDTGSADEPAGLDVDSRTGSIVVAGFTANSDGAADYWTVAYSSAGEVLWRQRYDSADQEIDRPTAIAVDGKRGIVYVTGISDSSTALGDEETVATVAYSTSGQLLRVDRYGVADTVNRVHDIAVDPIHGSVAVTGSTGPIYDDDSDLLTLAYPPAR